MATAGFTHRRTRNQPIPRGDRNRPSGPLVARHSGVLMRRVSPAGEPPRTQRLRVRRRPSACSTPRRTAVAGSRPAKHNGPMPDLPVRALTRSAKMAALPIGHASRAALGVGKRIGGAPAEAVAAELQARTAEQMFRVLGELKGGAMKVGQAMSIFEAALPEDVAAPVPRDPDEAAGAGARAARREGARSAGRQLRQAVAPQVPVVRRQARGSGEHRPGASGGLEGRPTGRGEGPVPGGRQGADVRPGQRLPAGPDDDGVGPGRGPQAPAGRAGRAGQGGVGLREGGRVAARLRQGLPRTTPRSSSPTSWAPGTR